MLTSPNFYLNSYMEKHAYTPLFCVSIYLFHFLSYKIEILFFH